MAFMPNNQSANSSAATNESWKAQGFINLYLPTANGRKKLGAIPLKDSKQNERALLEWLNADEANINKLAEKLIVEYQSAAVTEGNAFLLD